MPPGSAMATTRNFEVSGDGSAALSPAAEANKKTGTRKRTAKRQTTLLINRIVSPESFELRIFAIRLFRAWRSPFVRAYAGAEHHWRPIESTSPAQPQHGIFKKLILRRAIQNLAAVAHVGIDHPVFCIDPRHAHISSAQRVPESQRMNA